MTILNTTRILALSALASLTACSGDDSATATDGSATATTSSTSSTSSTSASTGDTSSDAGSGSGTSSTSTTGVDTETTGGGDPFVFDATPPDQLTQIDRMGMPAINTAVITSKDKYNGSSPADDANGDFVPEIVANLTGLHGALDDDLAGLGLTPCVADVTCVAQAGPLVIPDTLKLDLSQDSGFPNGRKLADPVMDVTLAVVLLDLQVHAADLFASIPLNPPANDKAFLADFPYLAEPH
ncbi:MAG: DUF4331 family protein [Myxococcales bacterium]|nr:DUF4331 family protein [Myxococcales bacterium]MCB9702999.1 DUF4331 family protein [Myxococcales bacterium]